MTKSLLFASLVVASFTAGCDDATGAGGAGGATSSSGASMTTSSTATGSTSTGTSTTSTSTSGSSSVSTGSSMGMFSLTSSAVMEGMTLPPQYTCAFGANQVSPPLAWTGAPGGTMSYAIVFTDKSFMDYKHSAIYDIPASVTSLPEDVETVYQPSVPAGAKQTKAWDGGFGYSGPCPPATHTYEFKIYALDVATLPGMTMNSTIAQVEAAALEHDLASTTLTVLGDP